MDVRRTGKIVLVSLACLVVAQLLQSCSSSTRADGQTKFVVADAGRTRYVILRSADASPVEVRATDDLADYLRKISGAAFPVVTEDKDPPAPKIIVGKTAAKSLVGDEAFHGLGTDGFIVRTLGEQVVLAGDEPRGTAFAVYSFLERDLGCLWFNPFGEEHVPRKDVLAVPELDRREMPAFQYRTLNASFWRMTPFEREAAFRLRNKIVQYEQPEWGGPSRVYARPTMHSSFFYLIPPAQVVPAKNNYHDPKDVEPIFKEHPEWFSLIGGKRVPNRQLCFSNPELRATFTANVLSNIEKYSGKGVFNISERDVEGAFCECDGCKACVERQGGADNAPMLAFVVDLAETVKKTYPDAVLSIWAYNEMKAPATLVFPDNVVLDFIPLMKRNFAAPLAHPSNGAIMKALRAWLTKVRQFDTWYYPNPYAVSLAPIGNLRILGEDFRMYKQMGMKGVYFVEQDVGVLETHHLIDLQSWLVTKLEWDPDQDVDALITTFVGPFYGAAAPMMREYIDRLEQATREMKTTLFWSPSLPEFTYLTPAFLRETQAIFDRAEAVVADDPPRLLRVRQGRMSLDRACLLLWDKVAGDLGWAKSQKERIVQRYEATFAATAAQRLLKKEYKDDVLKSFALFMRAYAADIPIPAQFAGAQAKQFFPDALFATYDTPGICVVDDPLAATGRALMRTTQGEAPLAYGYYDTTNKLFLCQGEIAKTQIRSDGYAFYKLGRAKLSPKGYVWSANWKMQIGLDSLFDPTHPDREYDFYLSLRFEGPTYLSGQEGKTDAIFVDRLFFVPAKDGGA